MIERTGRGGGMIANGTRMGLLTLACAVSVTLGWAADAPNSPDSAEALRSRSSGAAESRNHEPRIAAFSTMAPGIGARLGWREESLRGVARSRFSIVLDERTTVLQIDSDAAGSALVAELPEPGARDVRTLAWRWKPASFPPAGALEDRRSDDFAGRVYVMFDYPLEKVPFAQRFTIRLARLIYGEQVPVAALCYLWAPGKSLEQFAFSPYTSRVRMIVVRNEDGAGRWQPEERDLLNDFQRAFGDEYGTGMPPVRAVALAADSDQSASRLSTRFGDIELR